MSRYFTISVTLLMSVAAQAQTQETASQGSALPAESSTELVPKLLATISNDPAGEDRDAVLDEELLRRLESGDRFLMNLDEGVLTAYVDRVERRSGSSFSVFATLDDDPGARIILTIVNSAVVGVIRAPNSRIQLQLSTRPDGSHVVRRLRTDIDECATKPGGRRFASPLGEGDGGESGGTTDAVPRGACADEPTVAFDVLVVYTTLARDRAGSDDQILMEAQHAIDVTNQAYVDSNLGPALRARLVFAYGAAYAEHTDMELDRDNLADPSDGLLDNAHGFRDLYGADFVVLLVADVGQDTCGIAYCTPSGSAEGFCVVRRDCASGRFSFPHELGHLQGCAHNREDDGTPPCNEDHCWSYGHRFTGNDGQGYRTVMAYNNSSGDLQRIGIFSTPYVLYQGVPCGEFRGDCDDDEYNVLTISQTAQNRENWRNPKFNVWVDFGYVGTESGSWVRPWNTVTEGVIAVFGFPAPYYSPPQLWLKPGVSSETGIVTKPMTIRACGGAALIGSP